MATKERLHRLVDDLPDSEVTTAERFLEYLTVAGQDPFLRGLLGAPLDDEPETDGERAAVAEAQAALERGEVISDDQLTRDLGWIVRLPVVFNRRSRGLRLPGRVT